MPRLCERPGCAEPATVAWGFDATRLVVWFESRATDGPSAGGICKQHADAMRLPKGWWLEDRRTPEALFPVAAPDEAVDEAAAGSARKRRGRSHPAPPTPEPGPEQLSEPAWVPAFSDVDDRHGLFDAKTPLLARAFGNGPSKPERPARGSRRRAGGSGASLSAAGVAAAAGAAPRSDAVAPDALPADALPTDALPDADAGPAVTSEVDAPSATGVHPVG